MISSGEYELLPDYKSLWYWFVEEAAKNTKESLLEIQFGATQVSDLHCYFGINTKDECLGGKCMLVQELPIKVISLFKMKMYVNNAFDGIYNNWYNYSSLVGA